MTPRFVSVYSLVLLDHLPPQIAELQSRNVKPEQFISRLELTRETLE